MKKTLWIIGLLFIFFLAYVSKPDDKTCIERAVAAVWKDRTPNKYTHPEYYEQFMDLTSQSVDIDDWVLFKVIKYEIKKEKTTVAVGALKRVFIL